MRSSTGSTLSNPQRSWLSAEYVVRLIHGSHLTGSARVWAARTSRGAALRWVACAAMRWRVRAVAHRGGHSGGDRCGLLRRPSPATAQRAGPAVPDPDRSYGYVDNRCGLLDDSSIQEMLGAQSVVRPYSGAVCQYVLTRLGPSRPTMIDVVFSWFDTGNLDRERDLAAAARRRGHRHGHRAAPGVPGAPRHDRSGLLGDRRRRPRRAELVGAVRAVRADGRPLQGRREAALRDAVVGHVTWPPDRSPSAPQCWPVSPCSPPAAVRRTGPPRPTRPQPRRAADSSSGDCNGVTDADVAEAVGSSTLHQGRRQRRRLLLAGEHHDRHVRRGHGHLDVVVPRQRYGHRARRSSSRQAAR